MADLIGSNDIPSLMAAGVATMASLPPEVVELAGLVADQV